MRGGNQLCVVGPNGSGKTTLLLLLGGFALPDTGEVALHLNGRTIPSTHRDYWRYVFYCGSLVSPSPTIGVRELIRVTLAGRGFSFADVSRLTDHVLGDIQLSAFAFARYEELSTGMQWRLWLALAFAVGVPVVLLDEPFSHLDSHWQSWATEKIHQHTKKGNIAVVAVPDGTLLPLNQMQVLSIERLRASVPHTF